jgi:sulfur-carrier protein
MKIQVRYFASLRERLGPAEQLELPAGGSATIATLRDALIARGGAHAEVLARGRAVRAALDQTMADESQPLHEGAEVAFFPPVTGG